MNIEDHRDEIAETIRQIAHAQPGSWVGEADALLASPALARLLAAARAEGEVKSLRECTDLYCQADKDLIRGWANTLARRIARGGSDD